MSTDGPRGRARRSRTWRRSVLATVGVLAVATVGLGLAGAVRGPRLDGATVAADTALQRAGQRLLLQADQSIDPVTAEDVRVDPATPVEVADDGRTITVRFAETLRALTEYRVTAEVRGSSTGIAGTIEYAFTTPDLDVAVLRRDLEGPDEITARGVSGGDPRVLLRADRIQEFALTRDGVAAVLLADEGPNGRLVLAGSGDDAPQDVPLPGEGRVQQLRVSDTTGHLGFTFTEDGDDVAVSRLLISDPLDPSGVARPVRGLDGEPLSVLDWLFVPGTPYLVAQAFDESLLLVDTTDLDAAPSPLGQHAEVRGLLPGTLRLVVADPLSGGTIDLATGETAPLELPDDGLPPEVYRGRLVTLAEDRYAEVVSAPTGGAGFVLDYEVLLVDADGATVVYDPAPGAAVRDICLSPNGQYLAVEVQDPAGELDGYPNVPGRTATTTYFVDLETGAANRGITGFAASWCG